MADRKNDARAMRILEIFNDFRTLQVHIAAHVTRAEATPPDAQSQNLAGYALLRQCRVEAQTILGLSFNPAAMGIQAGQAATEAQRLELQRIILDASARRFQAHRIYLRVAAATRWIAARTQVLQSAAANGRRAEAMRALDQRLRDELVGFTDAYVVTDLRNADVRHGYWLDDDPSLDRMLAWIRTQR